MPSTQFTSKPMNCVKLIVLSSASANMKPIGMIFKSSKPGLRKWERRQEHLSAISGLKGMLRPFLLQHQVCACIAFAFLTNWSFWGMVEENHPKPFRTARMFIRHLKI